MVPITSDKGMCGSINSGIVRDMKEYVLGKDRARLSVMAIGEKGAVGLTRPMPDLLKNGISEISTPYNYPTAMALGENIVREGEEVNADKIVIFYNEFVSAIKTNIRHLELMPRKRFIQSFRSMFLYNMNKQSGVPALYDLYVSSNLWVALLNNAASEQSARMNAMENASKNAGEILDGLTLKYNKARQARITTELVEIISGMTSLE